jgi:hypothetical protein
VEARANELRVGASDATVNEILSRPAPNGAPPPAMHFNQTEDFFLGLERPFTVHSVPIHHDIADPHPTERYSGALRRMLAELAPLAPRVFSGLTYYFDPADVLHPTFFRVYRVEEAQYLYLLKIDLSFRSQESEILERSTNDVTATYRTSHLFLESLFVPIAGVNTEGERIVSFAVDQTISQTWIGETGRGYFQQGIWMDLDLTKFFSKLFVPAGKRLYPFYPFVCKLKTVCQTVVEHGNEARRARLPYLHGAVQFLKPHLPEIQEALRGSPFSENLDAFRRIKAEVPPSLSGVWAEYHVEAYLNAKDMKEYRLERRPT